MRPPASARLTNLAELDQIPDRPAVLLLWAGEGKPYLARTALLRRRLKRLLTDRERVSRVLNLRGVAERVEYWLTGSQIESALIHLELAQKHFPDDWPRLTRLRPPAFVRLTLDHPYPRTMVTSRFPKLLGGATEPKVTESVEASALSEGHAAPAPRSRGLFYGPFASRAAAERFEAEALDLFQVRRCEENLTPSPAHPGCIYGEMNRCLRPCQQAVSAAEYRAEAERLERFLRTGGKLLKETTEAARDRMSAEMQFEEADRLHQRLSRIADVQALSGDLARSLDRLHGVAVTPAAEPEAIELWFLLRGRWQGPRRVILSERAAAGSSLDRRLRELTSALVPTGEPDLEHLAILMRWHGSSWRDGEWIAFDDLAKVPYRKLVNAMGRVAHSRAADDRLVGKS